MSIFETAILFALFLGVSLLFFYFVDYTYSEKVVLKYKNNVIFFRRVCLFIAVFLPCVLAGLRADEVGTDVLVYAKSSFLKRII